MAESRRLLIDLETYSSVDISKAGVFKYVEAPDFEILLLAFAWDNSPVRVLDLTASGETEDWLEMHDIRDALQDPNVVKVAHNSAFERACLTKYLKYELPAEEWEIGRASCRERVSSPV